MLSIILDFVELFSTFNTSGLFYLIARGVFVVTSDICDYEVRRSLILASLPETLEIL